jgi:hypothetical protein
MAPLTRATRRSLGIASVAAASAIAVSSPALAQSTHVTQAGAPIAKPAPGKSGIRLGAPQDSYVAERAKSAELDGGRAVTQELQGKKIRFTPARVTESLDEAAQGHVLGVLETEVEGAETGLPPGKYTIFAHNVGGEWEAFAELDGDIVQQALTVTAADAKAPDDDKPAKPRLEVSEGVWCWVTGPFPAPKAWARYDHRGYWHYYPTEWGRYQTLTVCW